jgi:hypothetical protein
MLFKPFEKLVSACFIQFNEKPSYYLLIIYIKMFETIVVLTYVYSEPSTDKVYLLCDITLYNANGLKISLKYANLSLFHFKEDNVNAILSTRTQLLFLFLLFLLFCFIWSNLWLLQVKKKQVFSTKQISLLQIFALLLQNFTLLFTINCTEINQSQASNIFMYIISCFTQTSMRSLWWTLFNIAGSSFPVLIKSAY